MSKNSGGHIYLLELKFDKSDFDLAKAVSSFQFIINFDSPLTLIKIQLNLTREQYDTYVLPNRDKILFKLKISQDSKDEKSVTNPIDVIEEELILIEEKVIDNPLYFSEDMKEGFSEYIFTLATKKNNKQIQKLIKNKVYYKKNRDYILKDILKGTKYNIISEIYEPDKEIEQFFIPPMTEFQAIHYANYWLGLFKNGNPLLCQYDIKGTLNIGSVVKNKLKPLRVLYATDPEQDKLVKQIIDYNNRLYNYVILTPITVHGNPIIETANITTNISYHFNPLNELEHTFNKNLKEYKINDIIMENNIYGSKDELLKQIKNNNSKGETWSRIHTGVPLIDRKNLDQKQENENFPNQFISNLINRTYKISNKFSWNIIVNDFLILGKHVQLFTALRKINNSGEYYIKDISINFSRGDATASNYAFLSEVEFSIRGAINTTKL